MFMKTVFRMTGWGLQIGVIYGSPETTPGGNALKFYCSVRVDIRRAGFIKVSFQTCAFV